jgi:hypothetical protein
VERMTSRRGMRRGDGATMARDIVLADLAAQRPHHQRRPKCDWTCRNNSGPHGFPAHYAKTPNTLRDPDPATH